MQYKEQADTLPYKRAERRVRQDPVLRLPLCLLFIEVRVSDEYYAVKQNVQTVGEEFMRG